MSNIILVKENFKFEDLKEIASLGYGELIKAVVDVRSKFMAIGGEMHSDEEELLLEQGSNQEDLWGINLYPELSEESWIEFDSMINVRPKQNNRSRRVEDLELQKKIIEIVNLLIKR